MDALILVSQRVIKVRLKNTWDDTYCTVVLQCCELAGKLAEDLEGEGLKGKTLTLKLKPPTFEVRRTSADGSAELQSTSSLCTSANLYLSLLALIVPVLPWQRTNMELIDKL